MSNPLANTFAPPSIASQRALREARAQSCCYDYRGSVRLLVGLPLSVRAPRLLEAQPAVDAIGYELSKSAEYLLAPATAKVVFALRPQPCSVLAVEPATVALRLFCDAVLAGELQDVRVPLGATDTAWVWRAAVEIADDSREELAPVFFRVTKGLGQLQAAFTQRAGALFEENDCGKVVAYPLTAYWNSLSMARITAARHTIKELRAVHPQMTAKREGTQVILKSAETELTQLAFPEETTADISELFTELGGLQ